MVETSGLDAYENLAGLQRGNFLNVRLDHLRTTGAERASDPALSNRACHLRNVASGAGDPPLTFFRARSSVRFTCYLAHVGQAGYIDNLVASGSYASGSEGCACRIAGIIGAGIGQDYIAQRDGAERAIGCIDRIGLLPNLSARHQARRPEPGLTDSWFRTPRGDGVPGH